MVESNFNCCTPRCCTHAVGKQAVEQCIDRGFVLTTIGTYKLTHQQSAIWLLRRRNGIRATQSKYCTLQALHIELAQRIARSIDIRHHDAGNSVAECSIYCFFTTSIDSDEVDQGTNYTRNIFQVLQARTTTCSFKCFTQNFYTSTPVGTLRTSNRGNLRNGIECDFCSRTAFRCSAYLIFQELCSSLGIFVFVA